MAVALVLVMILAALFIAVTMGVVIVQRRPRSDRRRRRRRAPLGGSPHANLPQRRLGPEPGQPNRKKRIEIAAKTQRTNRQM
jgi:hypothetical protein